MALIDFVIPDRDFEVIRDRVGLILAAELLNQAAITYNDLFLAPVYVQRSKPVMPDECPLINVSIDTGSYSNNTVIDSSGQYQIYIDVFTIGSSDEASRGDTVASFDCQKLAGKAMGVISNPVYTTLNFPRPFIENSEITGFENGTIERGESTNLSMVRITLSVKSGQAEIGQQGVVLADAITTVKISLTANGYKYEYVAP